MHIKSDWHVHNLKSKNKNGELIDEEAYKILKLNEEFMKDRCWMRFSWDFLAFRKLYFTDLIWKIVNFKNFVKFKNYQHFSYFKINNYYHFINSKSKIFLNFIQISKIQHNMNNHRQTQFIAFINKPLPKKSSKKKKN